MMTEYIYTTTCKGHYYLFCISGKKKKKKEDLVFESLVRHDCLVSQSLAIGHWVLISERLILVIGIGHEMQWLYHIL